jgi:acyl-CoA synthetase (AMP-forming)/AMP-acid ligase II
MSDGPRPALPDERDRAATLSQLLRAGGAARPDYAIFARIGARAGDAVTALRVAAIDALADHYCARFRDADVSEGARILIRGAPEPRALAAIVGALRAGLNVMLAPAALEAASIADPTRRCDAAALAGPSEFASLQLGERLFEAAAMAEKISLVALYGEGAAGALALDAPLEEAGAADTLFVEPELLTIDVLDTASVCAPLSQSQAADVARAFLARAGLRPGQAIASMISLGSPAGLVGGAFAPLIGGAHVVWQAPFAALRFVEALDASAPAHLLAPVGAVEALGAAGLLTPQRLASLTLVAAEGTKIRAFPHDLDLQRVCVLRIGAGANLRLDAWEAPPDFSGNPPGLG